MWGSSGVAAILGALATRKRVEHLQLTEQPNMPFLYWLAVMGSIFKPKWTDSKTWPSLTVGESARRKNKKRTPTLDGCRCRCRCCRYCALDAARLVSQ